MDPVLDLIHVKKLSRRECLLNALTNRLRGKIKTVDIVIVQVYMPTTDRDRQDINQFTMLSVNFYAKKKRGHVNAIVIGDFKSIVGEELRNNAIRSFGLGIRI